MRMRVGMPYFSELGLVRTEDPGKAEESVGAGTSIVVHSKCFSWGRGLCIGKFYAKEV